jgi:uncharacterized protein
MVGRETQTEQLHEALNSSKSAFIALTGRRRVGKTYLVDEVFKKNICLRVTGIQDGDTKTQILNFTQKLAEHSGMAIVSVPKNWQEVFLLVKTYLKSLSNKKKHVIFLDELPWINTPKSGFIQMLAHLWNDYLSKESHFVLVVCGSSTSWITNKIVNDKGGFHNRLTHHITLQPFTLRETKQFLYSKNVKLTDSSIAELYMILGGLPYYLEQILPGESPTVAVEKLCFFESGILKNEYENLYKAIFENSANHEAIVETLATAKSGLSREEILAKSKLQAGGPYQRAINELIVSGFVKEETPFGRKKRGSIYKLIDEYSVFYHKFIKPNKKPQAGVWQLLANTQAYKIWTGYAFETLCAKHINEIKNVLGIQNVYTETSSFAYPGKEKDEGFQIDMLIDRKDKTINICECKYYEAEFEVTKAYAAQLRTRKMAFKTTTQTKKNVFTTLITNQPIKPNEYSLEAVDVCISVGELM